MLKRLSGPNPFPASCRPSVQPLPPDSAGEPRLAVSPGNPRGRTFSAPRQNFPEQQLKFMHDPQILALPDGTLVEVFVLFNDSEELPASFQVPVTMEAMRSTDGGVRWSSPIPIAQAPNAVP